MAVADTPPTDPSHGEKITTTKDPLTDQAQAEKDLSDDNAARVEFTLGDGEDILALQDLDPALNMKMHLVNNVSGPVQRPLGFS